jgi:hypothetical protein
MTTPLLDLPSYQRQKLVTALRTKALAPPYPDVAVISTIGAGNIAGAVAAELRALDEQDIGGAAIAYALTLAGEASASVHRPDLVWSGETVPGVHARKTRQVFDELVGGAERSLWISSYTYWDGAQAFAKLAARMDARPDLAVKLLLNIQRGKDDNSTAEALASAFASTLWKHWPGDRHPEVYFDPRALKDGTEKAFDENVEVGLLTRDRTVASALARHFAVLIQHGILEPLPG